MEQPIWNTPAGSLGIFVSLNEVSIQLSASPVYPALTISYSLLSGTLPDGLYINVEGLIYGTPSAIPTNATYVFVVRVTDNLQNIRDRTFSIAISGVNGPQLTIPSDTTLLSTNDSIWVELAIPYTNAVSTNTVTFRLTQGFLPPGLEMNEAGIIRGYANPPVVDITVPETTTGILSVNTSNVLTCISTINFSINRQIRFSGTQMFSNLDPNITYYIKSIINDTDFTISLSQDGPTLPLTSGSGYMIGSLPATSVGYPTIKTYSFIVLLESNLGTASALYSITVINQNTPLNQGGPGKQLNTRNPVILNTQPRTFYLNDSDPYYGYYIVPDMDSTEFTVPPTVNALIGNVQNNNYFAFKIIGHDFDGNDIRYTYSNLPLNFVGDITTGWIIGTPALDNVGINQYSFGVYVSKTNNSNIKSELFNFAFNLCNQITNTVIWKTDSDLGDILNRTISTKNVSAIADVELKYRLTSGILPPNLTLLSNGEITGFVANQPTSTILYAGDNTVFTFTIEAYSPVYPAIQSFKTFTMTVMQEYDQPTDILYIKAAPSIPDRLIIEQLLTDENIIPTDMVYRPTDIYFGKAQSIIYEHAYGIYASSINQYLEAVTKNHYWRNITLGELKTAVAKDENGTIIYEVVYSEIIDNLVNTEGVSIPESIIWPKTINLNLGPWYTSITDIYASYSTVLDQQYYTSLSPGSVRVLYPNSLYDMRSRIIQNLGQEYDSRLLPAWMTSQQENGSTLGFTQAWVICYTKPGFAEIIKNNIETMWLDPIGNPYKLNLINFKIDRFSVNKSTTYNYDNNVTPPAWTNLPSAKPVPDPIDSKDFYVLFPRQTILPNEGQQ